MLALSPFQPCTADPMYLGLRMDPARVATAMMPDPANPGSVIPGLMCSNDTCLTYKPNWLIPSGIIYRLFICPLM